MSSSPICGHADFAQALLVELALIAFHTKCGMIWCMAVRTALTSYLPSAELHRRYRACRDAKEARRWQVLWQLSLGTTIKDIAAATGLHRNGIRAILTRYNDLGPDGVRDGHRRRPGGRHPTLSPDQQATLNQLLDGPALDGGLWTGPKVAAWISTTIGRTVPKRLGWTYLRKLGFTLQRPRPRHQRAATPEQQQAWKKTE